MEKEKKLTKEDAINQVEQGLSERKRYVTYKEPSPGGDALKYSTRKVSEVYRESQIDLTVPSSPSSGVVSNELIVTLDKATSNDEFQSFDKSYNVVTVPDAVASEVVITNPGSTDAKVIVSGAVGTNDSYQVIPITDEKGLVIGGGQTVTIPVTTNLNSITTEEIVMKHGAAGNGRLDIKVNSKTTPSNPKTFSEPMRTPKKPSLSDIKKYPW